MDPLALDALRIRRDDRLVLDGLSARFAAGTRTALLGPNGSGKSTLLAAILGGIRPDAGHVRRRPGLTLAYVPQDGSVPEALPLTVRDTVRMGAWARRGRWRPLGREGRIATEHTLDLLGLGGIAERRIQEVSGGQRRRAFLARALVQDAELLLLDEPATGLDAASTAVVNAAIIRFVRAGGCVIEASHDPTLERRADRILRLGAENLSTPQR